MADLTRIARTSGVLRGHVIFVHGLGGDAVGTWKSGEAEDTFWPRWLADDLQGVTVWTVGYEAPRAMPLRFSPKSMRVDSTKRKSMTKYGACCIRLNEQENSKTLKWQKNLPTTGRSIVLSYARRPVRRLSCSKMMTTCCR